MNIERKTVLSLAFLLLSSLTAGAQHQQLAKRTGTIEPLPRDLEIQLALSALPAHLRDHATVWSRKERTDCMYAIVRAVAECAKCLRDDRISMCSAVACVMSAFRR